MPRTNLLSNWSSIASSNAGRLPLISLHLRRLPGLFTLFPETKSAKVLVNGIFGKWPKARFRNGDRGRTALESLCGFNPVLECSSCWNTAVAGRKPSEPIAADGIKLKFCPGYECKAVSEASRVLALVHREFVTNCYMPYLVLSKISI